MAWQRDESPQRGRRDFWRGVLLALATFVAALLAAAALIGKGDVPAILYKGF